jgi:hypothetical protein
MAKQSTSNVKSGPGERGSARGYSVGFDSRRRSPMMARMSRGGTMRKCITWNVKDYFGHKARIVKYISEKFERKLMTTYVEIKVRKPNGDTVNVKLSYDNLRGDVVYFTPVY